MAENLDPEVINRLTEAYRNHYESLRDTNLIADAQLKAEKSKLDLNKAGAAAIAASTSVFQASTKAVESFTRTLISEESSFKKITSIGAAVADTVAEAAKQLGGVGAVMGVAIQAATKLAQAMAAQAEAVVKTKDQVAKFGAVGELSSDALYGLAKQAGYYSLNMNKLYAAAGRAGGDLLIFSKNMSGGVETFAKMAAVGEGTLQAFNSLGISQPELAEYQADYVKYLAASGVQLNANQKTQAALTKGSLEYTKNVLELSALTGKDVDTVKKKQQEAQASLDIQIHYGKLQARAAELRLADDKASLEEAAALEAQMEKERAIIEKVHLTFDAATTAAVRNAIATGGAFTEISSNLAAAGVDIGKLVRLAKDQSLTAGQASAAATEEIAAGVKRSVTNFGTSMTLIGDGLGKQVLGSIENNAAIAKGAAEAIESQKIVADKIANPTGDYLKSMQNAFDQFTRRAQQEGDKILSGVNPFMTDMATVMKNAKKIMEEAWEFMKKNVLEPANKYIKDVFGVDLKEAIIPVIETLGNLATEAHKLWIQFGGLRGIIQTISDKIKEYFPQVKENIEKYGPAAGAGAVVGGVAGGVLGGPKGAAAGAVVGAGAAVGLQKAEEEYQQWMYKKQKEYLPEWMLKRMGVTNSAATPKASDFGAYDPGVGDYGGDNKSTGSKGTSTKTISVSPSPQLADELAQGQRNLGKPTSPSSGASKTSTGSLKGDTSGLDSELQKRLMAAAEVYGKPLTINSGFRSYAKQKEMWDESVAAKRPGIGPGGMLVAKPGSSAHERGMAVDIQEAKNDPKAVEALKSQGLVQPYGKADEVHFEIAGLQNAAKSGSSSALMQTVSANPFSFEMAKPEPALSAKTAPKPEISPSTRSPSSSGSSVSTSEETYARMLYDIKDSITTKMQEMIDKVAESNDLLGKIMRHST